MRERTTLMMMEVIIGKYTVVFPFLNTISPGSFPINVPINPIIIRTIPAIIKSRFIQWKPPVQNNDRPVQLPFSLWVSAAKNQSEEDMAHKHLQSS